MEYLPDGHVTHIPPSPIVCPAKHAVVHGPPIVTISAGVQATHVPPTTSFFPMGHLRATVMRVVRAMTVMGSTVYFSKSTDMYP